MSVRCDRCEGIVDERRMFRFTMDVWEGDSATAPPHAMPSGHLCAACGAMVAERLTEFARGLGLPHAGPYGVDQRRARPMACGIDDRFRSDRFGINDCFRDCAPNIAPNRAPDIAPNDPPPFDGCGK